MPKYTENFNLKKPLETEFYNVGDHNENMDALDNALAEHSSNGGIHVTEPQKVKWDGKAETRTFFVTLSADWIGDAAPYTQTVSVEGMFESDNPIIDIISPTTEMLEGWGMVSKIETTMGAITAICLEDKPTVAVSLQLKVIR